MDGWDLVNGVDNRGEKTLFSKSTNMQQLGYFFPPRAFEYALTHDKLMEV